MKFESESVIESLVILEQEVAEFRCRYRDLVAVTGCGQLDFAIAATKKLSVAQSNLMRTLTKLKAAVLGHDHRIAAPVSVSALAMRAAVYVIEDCMRRLDVTLRGPNAQDCAQAMFLGRFRSVSDVSEFVRGRTQLIATAALTTGRRGAANDSRAGQRCRLLALSTRRNQAEWLAVHRRRMHAHSHSIHTRS